MFRTNTERRRLVGMSRQKENKMIYGSGLRDLVLSIREGDVVIADFNIITKEDDFDRITCNIDMMGFERWFGSYSAVSALRWVMEGIVREALNLVELDLSDPRYMDEGRNPLTTLTEFGDCDGSASEAGKKDAYEEDVKNFGCIDYRVVKLKKTARRSR